MNRTQGTAAEISTALEIAAEHDQAARWERRKAGRLLAGLQVQLPGPAWCDALADMGLDLRTAQLLIEGPAGGRICRSVQSREGC